MTRSHIAAECAEATLNDPRWASVLARDASADGNFYYSVRTSGVYCRPSCAARPARPENVAFHASREAAEQAGFRPCKRCKPDRAREEIRFAIGPSVLGFLLLAASRNGVCALLLGDDAAALTEDLMRRFPAASRLPDQAGLGHWLVRAAEIIADPRQALNLPLDLRGTDFQRHVWQVLRTIPAGKTASYAQIAQSIGAPKAVRAVASACGANAIAVAIPCHRILRSNGALSGYRWGVARKQALLAREAA
jgi:AraC family transcriptional regulator of adaptative response/methylated-DNA-[protein]-cysteine methyltransferase